MLADHKENCTRSTHAILRVDNLLGLDQDLHIAPRVCARKVSIFQVIPTSHKALPSSDALRYTLHGRVSFMSPMHGWPVWKGLANILNRPYTNCCWLYLVLYFSGKLTVNLSPANATHRRQTPESGSKVDQEFEPAACGLIIGCPTICPGGPLLGVEVI